MNARVYENRLGITFAFYKCCEIRDATVTVLGSLVLLLPIDCVLQPTGRNQVLLVICLEFGENGQFDRLHDMMCEST